MSELQNEVRSCISYTEDFSASLSDADERKIDTFICSTYRSFLQRVWHDLPVSNSDGSALATVACMPLWELLNTYTSTCNPSRALEKGVIVQTLTAMYPKSKDRRCVFQQLNCCGSNGQNALPLSTHIPIEMSLTGTPTDAPTDRTQNEYVKATTEIISMARLGSYVDGKETPALAAMLRAWCATILPKCVLADSSCPQLASNSTAIVIRLQDSSSAWNSGYFFLLSLWSALVMGEYLGLAESKELASFLRSSRWSSQLVKIGNTKVAYAKILSPLSDISSLCVSMNLRSPSASVDTVPLVDPRVVQLLCGSGCAAFHANHAGAAASVYTQASISETSVSLMEKNVNYVEEQLNESIPNEIDFMGSSSSCRDFDQLAYLCRDLLFLPPAKSLHSKKSLCRKTRDLLFNRKRGRGGNDDDGPCLIPVKSALSHVMEKNSAESQVTLERLCSKWKKE
ncbi:hypothetical protein N2W54_006179 [Lotmaria passim]